MPACMKPPHAATGLLTKKFLALMNAAEDGILDLNKAADDLGVRHLQRQVVAHHLCRLRMPRRPVPGEVSCQPKPWAAERASPLPPVEQFTPPVFFLRPSLAALSCAPSWARGRSVVLAPRYSLPAPS